MVHGWGEDFCPAFPYIGEFTQSYCPPPISVVGLSATFEPGLLPTFTICNTERFTHRHHGHCTNERPNVHLVLQTLTRTLGGDTLSNLLPFPGLATGCGTVFYCVGMPQFTSRVYYTPDPKKLTCSIRRNELILDPCLSSDLQ